jgi:hypothetical protein
MKIPGFSAELTLDHANEPYRNGVFMYAETGAHIIQEFVGGQHCFWQCYPGSGCEYRCLNFPF